MTTLHEILKDETNPAVIFGTIHRRKHALAGSLMHQTDLGVDYTLADETELRDAVTIKVFESQLTSSIMETVSEFLSRMNTFNLLEAVFLAKGLTKTDLHDMTDFGNDLAGRCMYGTDGFFAYYRIKCPDSFSSDKVAA